MYKFTLKMFVENEDGGLDLAIEQVNNAYITECYDNFEDAFEVVRNEYYNQMVYKFASTPEIDLIPKEPGLTNYKIVNADDPGEVYVIIEITGEEL